MWEKESGKWWQEQGHTGVPVSATVDDRRYFPRARSRCSRLGAWASQSGAAGVVVDPSSYARPILITSNLPAGTLEETFFYARAVRQVRERRG
jgi:hypothetical protein